LRLDSNRDSGRGGGIGAEGINESLSFNRTRSLKLSKRISTTAAMIPLGKPSSPANLGEASGTLVLNQIGRDTPLSIVDTNLMADKISRVKNFFQEAEQAQD
jgi:hypothetical protein